MSDKLEIGEKYLAVKVVGHDWITAFPNKKRTGNQPHFKGDGVAIWVQTKKEPRKEEEELDEEKILPSWV